MNLHRLFHRQFELNAPKDEYGRVLPLENIDYSKAHVSRELVKKGLAIKYPGNKSFGFLLSHDIDWLFLKPWSIKTMANQQLKAVVRGDFKGFSNNFKKFQRFRHEGFELKKIIGINRQFNIRSTCFFLSLQSNEEDFNYHPSELTADFKLLDSVGYEIGLHGGHQAFRDSSKISAEKLLLEQHAGQVVSYRNHYLKFDPQRTWDHLNEAGFQNDATYGWATIPGFRNGMAHPFTHGQLTVIPLHLMDTTLFVYQKRKGSGIIDVLDRMLDEIEAVNGCFSLLWHNDNLKAEVADLYANLLERIMKRSPAVMTHKECSEWFRSNNYLHTIQRMVAELPQ